jgi:catechol 2,3-dioxygenase-like lactoylglutathione lyase family enzyme
MKLRALVATLALSALVIAGAGASTSAPAVTGVGAIGVTVSDLDRAVAFYTNVLQFTKLSETEVAGAKYERLEGIFGVRMRLAHLALGDERVDLIEYVVPKGRDVPADSRANDRWFQHIAIITSDMDAAYTRLRAYHVRYASTAPQRLPDWNQNAAGIRAFYFRDPDGHFLETLQFPPGKGLAKWHSAGKRLFLGIDHTAIVVSDTEKSLRFYRDVLGMRIAGTSDNYGTEQEHLNNVQGAHLRITSLRAQSGPGIELLEYLTPRDGRAAPGDERPNDLIHWQTTLDVADNTLEAALSSQQKSPIVDGKAIITDPDGHPMELVTP